MQSTKSLGKCLYKTILWYVRCISHWNFERGFVKINGHDFSHTHIIMSDFTVIIETPRKTAGKYVFDPVNQCYKLKKILPLGMSFPYDFGMIENTLAEDGDPADAMVITECITYPGVRLACRIIGALQAKQKEKGMSIRNDRFFMIPIDSVMFGHIKEIKHFSRQHNEQLQDFFSNYMKAEDKRLSGMKYINASNAKRALHKLLK